MIDAVQVEFVPYAVIDECLLKEVVVLEDVIQLSSETK